MAVRVFKFGGSSLNQAKTIRQAAEIIRQSPIELVVVVSAMGGMTDLLLKAGGEAASGDLRQLPIYAGEFRDRHLQAIAELLPEGQAKDALAAIVNESAAELVAICQSLATLGEFSPRAVARTVARGERVMAQLMSGLLQHLGTATQYIDAPDLIRVSAGPLGMTTDPESTLAQLEKILLPVLRAGRVPVVPGYIAANLDGELVTLGRGGSDYSAAILGSFLNAEAVTLYKEVDGLLTADPRYVPEARIVPELHFREAAELSYYGAKVLHPRSIIPLIKKQIPLFVKNTFHPEEPGTRIASDVGPGAYPVKAVTAILDQVLVSVTGNGMIGVPGVAERTFRAMSAAQISVSMISQASSEASICFTVANGDARRAKAALAMEFRYELDHEFIDSINLVNEVAIVAIVGLGMQGTKGIAARAFNSLAAKEINIIAIAQGSSELNISVVVAMAEARAAVAALHREYRLDKIKALPPGSGAESRLLLVGLGQIGRALCLQLQAQQPYFAAKLGIKVPVLGLADRSGLILAEAGFTPPVWERLLALKAAGQPLIADVGARTLLAEFRRQVWPLALRRGILVDLTAAETGPLLKEALAEGLHVVLANKKPLAGPYAEFAELKELASKHQRQLRYEATVGAGLPVLDTMAKLQDAGDEVIAIEGCLSGTLGYLMSALADGVPFSQAVRQAWQRGYTEADPREDLLGRDVARKALILARTMGMVVEMSEINLVPLRGADHGFTNVESWLMGLTALDEEYAELAAAARRDSKTLRYVASISRQGLEVGIKALALNSPLAQLQGSANQVAVRTRRYADNPLMVTGPGAGADVTAAGVLNDIVAIATLGAGG